MSTPLPTTTGPKPLRSHLLNRYTLVSFVAGAALAAALGATAWGAGMSCHHGMMMGGAQGTAGMSEHVDHMLKHLYVDRRSCFLVTLPL